MVSRSRENHSGALVVVGASAGGVEALLTVIGSLDPDLDASICVVLHMSGRRLSMLPKILGRSSAMPVSFAADRDILVPGRVFVSPPDHHLTVTDGLLRLSSGPKENGFRPSIDALFRSAADAFQQRSLGVILSGSRDDGAIGLHQIRDAGGVTMVQDPSDALFSAMPERAIAMTPPDFILLTEEIGPMISKVCSRWSTERPTTSDGSAARTLRTQATAIPSEALPLPGDAGGIEGQDEPDRAPSPFTCPECGGSLWLVPEGHLERYTCRVGHSFTDLALAAGKDEELEAALWSAVRALEEIRSLHLRLAERFEATGLTTSATKFSTKAAASLRHATRLRRLLLTDAGEPRRQHG